MRGFVDRPDAAAAPSLGRVGRYELIKPLAAGGMGEVFAAYQRDAQGSPRVVALKRIRPQFSSDAEFVRMFLNEARLAAKLDHPNIVRVHDFSSGDDQDHLVMEYLHGASLLEMLRVLATAGQAFPIHHALTVVSHVLAGLHHAHELREGDGRPLEVVHRDVSPGNILVTYEGEVKILDFGIARAAQATQTAQGSRKGKVQYMSPEQCHGLPVDRRSDVFAVGIVLYELCTMKRPFRGDNEFAVMNAIVAGRFRKPSEVVDFAFPPALERLIGRALEVDRNARFQTAHEMMEAVEQVARSLSLEISLPALGHFVESLDGRRPWPSPPPIQEVTVVTRGGVTPAPIHAPTYAPTHEPVRPRSWSWVPLVVVALVAVGLASWWTRPPPAEAPPPDHPAMPETARSSAPGPTDPPASSTAAAPPEQAPSSVAAPDAGASPPKDPPPDPPPVETAPAPSRPPSKASKPKRRPRDRRPQADSAPATPAESRDLRGIDGLLPSKK